MQQIFSRRSFIQQPFHGTGILQNGIGGLSLEGLREEYRAELFQRFLPNMDRYILDQQHGGFMCDFDLKESRLQSTTKKTWSEGRGIYIYASLYNDFGKDLRHLAIAKSSVDFILAHKPKGNEWWPAAFTREGELMRGEGDIYCNLYLAEGLVAFAKASREKHYLQEAKSLLLRALEVYDGADYAFPVSYGPADAGHIVAPRVVGHWMVFLRAATLYLHQDSDKEISELSKRCIAALLDKHLNPHSGLMNEALTHDFLLPSGKWASFSYLATAIQSLWMVMEEAVRKKDKTLFIASGTAFKKHLLVASDGVYGGFFRSMDNVPANTFKTDKVLSLQQEVMNGCMLLIEHAVDEMAATVFAETYQYVKTNFYRREYAFPVENGNRSMQQFATRGMGNYHHPRHLLMTLLALERIMARPGRKSGIFGDIKI